MKEGEPGSHAAFDSNPCVPTKSDFYVVALKSDRLTRGLKKTNTTQTKTDRQPLPAVISKPNQNNRRTNKTEKTCEGRIYYKYTTGLLCFWAYASCHVTCVQQTMNREPLQASALSFLFESGEFAVILIPTAALSGCGFGIDTL